MPFVITDTRVQSKYMLCEGETVDAQFVDLVFVIEAYVVIDNEDWGAWRTFCKGKDPITFHNLSNAESYRRLMAQRFGLEKAA